MGYSFVGNYNAFVAEAATQIIAAIRDPKAFRINQYAQMVRMDGSSSMEAGSGSMIGRFYRLDFDSSVRVKSLEDDVWMDGFDRPSFNWNKPRFDEVIFRAVRRSDGFRIGFETQRAHPVDVLVLASKQAQSIHMTKRTARLLNILQDASKWGNNKASANELNRGAGYWDRASASPESPNYLAIKKTIDAVLARVGLLTNGMLDEDGKAVLKMILSPNQAYRISQTPEIHDYLKGSPFAAAQVRGQEPGINSAYGLPDTLYGGVEVVVENSPMVERGPSSSDEFGSEASVDGVKPERRFVKNDETVIFVSRVGGLDSDIGTPAYSTAQIFYYDKEIDLETESDNWNRYVKGAVTSATYESLSVPQAGYLVTNVFSS